jgi:hypothetical protein
MVHLSCWPLRCGSRITDSALFYILRQGGSTSLDVAKQLKFDEISDVLQSKAVFESGKLTVHIRS